MFFTGFHLCSLLHHHVKGQKWQFQAFFGSFLATFSFTRPQGPSLSLDMLKNYIQNHLDLFQTLSHLFFRLFHQWSVDGKWAIFATFRMFTEPLWLFLEKICDFFLLMNFVLFIQFNFGPYGTKFPKIPNLASFQTAIYLIF